MQFLLRSPLKTCTFKAFPASTHSFIWCATCRGCWLLLPYMYTEVQMVLTCTYSRPRQLLCFVLRICACYQHYWHMLLRLYFFHGDNLALWFWCALSPRCSFWLRVFNGQESELMPTHWWDFLLKLNNQDHAARGTAIANRAKPHTITYALIITVVPIGTLKVVTRIALLSSPSKYLPDSCSWTFL